MKEIDQHQFNQVINLEEQTPGQDDVVFYRTDNHRIYGVVAHRHQPEDWGYALYMQVADRVIPYDCEIHMTEQQARDRLVERIQQYDQACPDIGVTSSVTMKDGEFVAVVHLAPPAFQLFAQQYRIPGCYVLLEVEGPFPTKEEAVQAGQYCMQELDRQYDKYMNDNEVSKDN